MLGRIHLVAKGDTELFFNGEPVKYEDSRKDPERTDALSPPLLIAAGDTIAIKFRGTATFRGVLLGITSETDKKIISLPAASYRFLAKGSKIEPEFMMPEFIRNQPTAPPTVGMLDAETMELWQDHGIRGSAFIKSDERGVWYAWGIVITREMLETGK